MRFNPLPGKHDYGRSCFVLLADQSTFTGSLTAGAAYIRVFIFY